MASLKTPAPRSPTPSLQPRVHFHPDVDKVKEDGAQAKAPGSPVTSFLKNVLVKLEERGRSASPTTRDPTAANGISEKANDGQPVVVPPPKAASPNTSKQFQRNQKGGKSKGKGKKGVDRLTIFKHKGKPKGKAKGKSAKK